MLGFDYTYSQILNAVGSIGVCAAIGALFGEGVGGLIGAVIGAIVWYTTGDGVLDENGNIWWWEGLDFFWWVISNETWIYLLYMFDPVYAFAYVYSALLSFGYIRIGPWTFVDAIGAGEPHQDPPPVHYCVNCIAQYNTWAYGQVNNPDNLVGDADGYYAQIYGGNYNDGGVIVGWMNDVSYGEIHLYAYSDYGYWTHLYVYTSWNNYNDWTQISSQYVYGDGSGPYWIDCGYSGSFRYIAIVAIDDQGDSANLYIDSVCVNP